MEPLSDNPAQAYVAISYIEEDGLGEELEVIWELEPIRSAAGIMNWCR